MGLFAYGQKMRSCPYDLFTSRQIEESYIAEENARK